MKDIVLINEADYSQLLSDGSFTKNGITHYYSNENLYIIDSIVNNVEHALTADYATRAGTSANATYLTNKPVIQQSANDSDAINIVVGGKQSDDLTVPYADYAGTTSTLSSNPSFSTVGTTQIKLTAGGRTSSPYTVPYASNAGSVDWDDITNIPDTFAPTSHNHDDRYVSSLGTNGDYVTWTKNGSTNNLTVPYANNADRLDGKHADDFVSKISAAASAVFNLNSFYRFDGVQITTPFRWSTNSPDKFAFTVRIYCDETVSDFVISGECNGDHHWYRPQVKLINGLDHFNFKFGWHDSYVGPDNTHKHLYFWIGYISDDANTRYVHGGLSIFNVHTSCSTDLDLYKYWYAENVVESDLQNVQSEYDTQPKHITNWGNIYDKPNFGTASTHAHGDYVTSIGTSGNTLTWAKGGVAQTAITVPYATSAGKWTTARNISISDADGTNTGAAVSVDGSAAKTLKLPATIKASLTGNATTASNADKVDNEHIHQIKAFPQNSSEVLFSLLPYTYYNVNIFNKTIERTVSMENAPYTYCWGPFETYATFISDYILVKPGDKIKGEVYAYRASTADTSLGGVLYCGIQQYDRNKKPIVSNSGTDYFVCSNKTVTNDDTWHYYSGIKTIPTSHTPYSGSDGGGVYYVKLLLYVNYNKTTATPTYIGDLKFSIISSSTILNSMYLPLAGGTMTGAINRNYTDASDVPVLNVSSNNKDIWLWRVRSADAGTSTSVSGVYGFGAKYLGTGTDNNNSWAMYADNKSGTQIKALEMKQSGDIFAYAPIHWANSTALPEDTNPNYFLTCDSFGNGGKTKWTSKANLATAIGLGNYLPLAGGELSGDLTIKTNAFRKQLVLDRTATGTHWGPTISFENNGTFLKVIGVDTDGIPYIGDNGSNKYPILHSNNYTDYTVTKTGVGASGTWGISITGNAATVESFHANDFYKKLYTSKKPTVVSWYRILDINTYGCSILVSIAESYNNGNPTASTFIVNVGYSTATITQIDRACRVPTNIDKIRIVKYNSGKFYIDVHYKNTSTGGNNVYVTCAKLSGSSTIAGLTIIDWSSVTDNLTENEYSGQVILETVNVSQTLNVDNAINLSGGAAGNIVYQTAANTTGFVSAGTTGQLLTYTANGPAWQTSAYLPLAGGTMTGHITMGGQAIYFGKTGSNGILQYSSGYPNYGIWYHDESVDKMTFSSSGNANSVSGADFAINGAGDGTLTARGNVILHEGNYDTYINKYVKLDAGAAEQTIKSNIGSLTKGVIDLWRNSGDHYTFLGFSNGTTESFLGGIGFKSQADHELYIRRTTDNTTSNVQYWQILHTGNTGLCCTTGKFNFDPQTKKIQSTKTNSAWDAQVYSTDGYADNVVLSFKSGETNKRKMIGLNSDPADDAGYQSIDYCWYIYSDGSAGIYESNTNRGTYVSNYTIEDEFRIEYMNGKIQYYHNGELKRSVARNISGKLYFDSSFYNAGSIYDYSFTTSQHAFGDLSSLWGEL